MAEEKSPAGQPPGPQEKYDASGLPTSEGNRPSEYDKLSPPQQDLLADILFREIVPPPKDTSTGS